MKFKYGIISGVLLFNRRAFQHWEAIRASVEGGGLDLLWERDQPGMYELIQSSYWNINSTLELDESMEHHSAQV